MILTNIESLKRGIFFLTEAIMYIKCMILGSGDLTSLDSNDLTLPNLTLPNIT